MKKFIVVAGLVALAACKPAPEATPTETATPTAVALPN